MREKSAIPWYTLALSAAGAVSLYHRLFTANPLNYYDDDAFYYFQIARNLVLHHRSTFDGIHLTNGYHPLWMLTLVALTTIASSKLLFFLIQTVTLASFITTFLLARSLFRFYSTNLALTQLAATAVALQALLLIRGGMEITLTIPLALALCCYRLNPRFHWSTPTATNYGLLAALVVLSRLDAVFLIAPLLALDLVIPALVNTENLLVTHPPEICHLDRSAAERRDLQFPRQSPTSSYLPSHLITILSAATPIALYLLSNHHYFHLWTPVSGAAKQLRLHHTFPFASISASLGPINALYRVIVIYPALLTLAAALIATFTSRTKTPRPTLFIASTLLTLPLVQLLTVFTLSDWPIWPWYIDTVTLMMTGSLTLLFASFPNTQFPTRTDVRTLLSATALLFAWLFAIAITGGNAPRRWTPFAQAIAAFAQTHPGIYAMGDCSGTAGYLIPHPLIQLEGLVMDAPYLDNIRQQRPLNDVLRDQHVRYYVTVDAHYRNGCWHTTEPIQAGPDSPHMQGLFCTEPVTTYPTLYGTVNIFDLDAAQ